MADTHYVLDYREDYVHLLMEGEISIDDLKNSTDEVLRLAQEKGATKLLEDIRNIDKNSLTMRLQTEGIGLLWQLRHFKKIALVFSSNDVGHLVLSTLQTLHFNFKCRAFDNEADAIAWLEEV